MNNRTLRRVALNGAGVGVFLFAIFPVYWMVSTAFKARGDIITDTPQPIPLHPTLDHFVQVLTGQLVEGLSYWDLLRNSLVITLSTVLLASVVSLLAATAVARFGFRGRGTFLIVLLIVQTLPAEALLIPIFVHLRGFDLIGTLTAVIIVNVAFTLGFSTLMLRGFVAAVPKELEEAAAIDGAGPARIFWKILFPLIAPGLVATSIFAFITAWNEFILAYTILVNNTGGYTLPIGLQYFFGQHSNQWGAIMAASTLLTIPVMIFFLIVQRRMVSGLVAGAVKG